MGTIFTRDFTASNSDPWTLAEFSKVYGGSYAPLIQSGAGWGPSTSGTELLYRATAYPQSTGVWALLDATWNDAAGTGRWVGIALRCDEDGTCYSCELDSNVGTTRCRIRRRVGGSWTTVSAYASPVGIPASAQLNSGVTLQAKIQNTDEDEVTVELYYGATLLATYTDTSASRIESGGTVGIVLDANWDDDDIVVDNLVVKDFEDDWSGPGDLDESLALIVDGTHYSWDELEAAGITVGTPRQSYTDDVVCELRDSNTFGASNTILYPGAVVTVALDGDIVAFGRLRQAGEALTPAEGRSYQLIGPMGLARSVLVRDPDTGAGTIRFNMPTDHEDYWPDRADLTIPGIVEWLIDNHLEGDGKLREQLAAPPDGNAYESSDMTSVDAVIPEVQVSGDVRSAIESVLALTDYVAKVEPDTRKWRFDQRNTGTIVQVDLADDHVTGEGSVDVTRNRTAVLIRGNRPETTPTTLEYGGGGGLAAGWPAGLESTHSAEDQWKNQDDDEVASTGTAGAQVTMTPNTLTMEAHEWDKGLIIFTSGAELDEQYRIDENSASTFTLQATAWRNGGPSAADTFIVRGDKLGGGRDNGHRILGRRFTLSDTTKGFLPGACGTASMLSEQKRFETRFTTHTPQDESEAAEIELDMPAIGLVNFGGTVPDPCDDGDTEYLSTAQVTIEIPTYDRTNPLVPTYRYPASGFYGTAYTRSNTKWSGGGKPGIGDPAVMEEYPLDVPAYNGSASQDAEMAKLAQMVLNVLSPLARELKLEIAGIDTSWAGLDKRVQVVETGGDCGDWETVTDLGVLAVEWNLATNTTTVYAGTQAAAGYDVQAMRRAFLNRSAKQHQEDLAQMMRELMSCFASAPKGAGAVGAMPPSQICAEQVTVKGSGGTKKSLDDVTPTGDEEEPSAASTPSASCTNCPGPVDNANALTNAQAFTGTGGQAKVLDFPPKDASYVAATGQNSVAKMIKCLVEHVQELHNSVFLLGEAINDVARVNSDESDRHCTFMNALASAIVQIQWCLLNDVEKFTTQHPDACALGDPGTITNCDICADYCAVTLPNVSCSLNKPT